MINNASELPNNNHIAYDVASIIFKINELESIYTTAKNDAMKLRRQLEGRKVNVFNTPPKQQQLPQVFQNESENVAEPQQKRGRGRPRKIKESIEMIRGDDMRDDQEDGNKMFGEYRNYISSSETSLLDDGEFNNAVYSIEDGELYVKTTFGKFYDINTMQIKGWFNSYLKKNVWV